MEIKRFYLSPNDFVSNTVYIKDGEFEHMTKVLRHKVGFKIIVCNNFDDFDYYATITAIEKNMAIAEIYNKVYNYSQTDFKITLYQALPKGDKLDLITQKAVELGVYEVTPFTSEYVNEEKFNIDRLEKINIEACKQCGRAKTANIGQLIPFSEMIERAKLADVAIMAYEKEEVISLKDIACKYRGKKDIALIIGSEGGFCEKEAQKALEAGIELVSLGKRIMRCETASIICCGILMYEMGAMNK